MIDLNLDFHTKNLKIFWKDDIDDFLTAIEDTAEAVGAIRGKVLVAWLIFQESWQQYLRQLTSDIKMNRLQRNLMLFWVLKTTQQL